MLLHCKRVDSREGGNDSLHVLHISLWFEPQGMAHCNEKSAYTTKISDFEAFFFYAFSGIDSFGNWR